MQGMSNRTKSILISTAVKRYRILKRYMQARTEAKQLGQTDFTLYGCFKKTAKNNASKVMVYYGDKTWTFEQVSEQ